MVATMVAASAAAVSTSMRRFRRGAAQLADHVDGLAVRQRRVHDQKVEGRPLAELGEALFTAGHRQHGVARLGEKALQEAAKVELIVDREDPRLGSQPCSSVDGWGPGSHLVFAEVLWLHVLEELLPPLLVGRRREFFRFYGLLAEHVLMNVDRRFHPQRDGDGVAGAAVDPCHPALGVFQDQLGVVRPLAQVDDLDLADPGVDGAP